MSQPRFQGIYTAIVTPMQEDGAVDKDGLTALLDDQLAMGIEGIVVCGTTGEASTLSPEERADVVRHTVEQVKGRVPVIAGAGHNNTRVAIELQRQVRELGCDGALQVTPWYNKPSQEHLYRHFHAILDDTPLPTVLYNVPGRCGVDMQAATVARVARQCPAAVAVKEATGSLARAQDILCRLHDRRPDFSVLSGEDSVILGLLAIGGHGVISVTSHLCARELVQMKEAFHAGRHDEAAALSRKVSPLQPVIFSHPNPVPAKAALAATRLKGRMSDHVRAPLYRLDEGEREALLSKLDDLGFGA